MLNAPHTVEEMCRAGCATRRAVRHWEDNGLLGEVARSAGDTRRYTAAQINTARVIAAAQFGGWSLDEIKEMVLNYDSEVYSALLIRLSDQVRAAVRLSEDLPVPVDSRPVVQEYDL